MCAKEKDIGHLIIADGSTGSEEEVFSHDDIQEEEEDDEDVAIKEAEEGDDGVDGDDERIGDTSKEGLDAAAAAAVITPCSRVCPFCTISMLIV